LTSSGLKIVEQAQDAGLKLLEDHVKSKSGSTHRKDKLLLYLGQVKVLSKDIARLVDDRQTGSDVLLNFISQSLC